jgi:hypothetical protein
MSEYGNFFKFEKDDIFHNTIKAYPKSGFYIYSGSVYYNNENTEATNFHTPNGHINLYDLNVNRNNVSGATDPQMIYPFVTKGGSFTSFSTISTSDFNLDFAFEDKLTGSYPLTASISVDRFDETFSDPKRYFLYALRNTLDHYTPLSPHYAYSSSFGDKTAQKLNIISIPSIFYGSSIKKGSVRLQYYVTGTLIAEAADTLKNGVLTQTSGSNSGEEIGIVLYNEGFIMLTSSTNIDEHTEQYTSTTDQHSASWHYFGVTSSYAHSPSSSFSLNFEGVSPIQTMTLFAHARENQLNYSNNVTFLSGNMAAFSSEHVFYEDAEKEIKNIVSSSYKNHEADFEQVTYISKIGIYDENKNLIAIAGLANPVRKIENRAYTFKIKLDI